MAGKFPAMWVNGHPYPDPIHITTFTGHVYTEFMLGALVVADDTGECRVRGPSGWLSLSATTSELFGISDIDDSELIWDDVSLTLTHQPLAPATSFDFYVAGNIFTKTTPQTATITDTQGTWYFYYDTSGTLQCDQVGWTIGVDTPVAFIYWDATANTSYDSLCEERHGILMPWETHNYLHEVFGAQFNSGLNITFTDGDGSIDAHAQVGLTSGIIHDEDLEINIVDAPVPAANFEQILTAPAQIPIWYRVGADANNRWLKSVANDYSFVYGGVGTRADYNFNNAGTWQQAQVANNRFLTAYICFTPHYTEPVVAIQGQYEYASEALADDESLNDLTLGGLFVVEIVFAYKLILQTSNGYGNTPHTRIRKITRVKRNAPAGAIAPGTQHNSTLERNAFPTHSISSINQNEIYLFDVSTGESAPYASITLALADAETGDVVACSAGTYVENVVIPDGVTLLCTGPATLGTGGDYSVGIVSDVGGEWARLIGPWVLVATDGSLSADVAAHLSLDPQVVIQGTVTGVYRVGRRWVLQNGEALATYIPADGSVVAVAYGDELWDGNTSQWMELLNLAGAIWIGDALEVNNNPDGVITGRFGLWAYDSVHDAWYLCKSIPTGTSWDAM